MVPGTESSICSGSERSLTHRVMEGGTNEAGEVDRSQIV